jgi:hypothetical protein
MTDQKTIRQYQILFKRGNAEWVKLEPGVHAGLYDKPEVNAGIQVLAGTPAFKAIVVLVDNDLFNIVTFEQPAIAPKAFIFEGHQ